MERFAPFTFSVASTLATIIALVIHPISPSCNPVANERFDTKHRKNNKYAVMDSLPPEHRHYGTVDKLLRKSVSEGQDFLFDSVKFNEELLNLETKYGFPYDVR
jgi:hypothetical protein